MIFRNLTGDNDWTFGKGIATYAQNEDAINLNIKTRLLSWVGDCFFALADGIDWLGLLEFGQKANLVEALKSNILQAYGVVGINSVDVTFDSRTRNILVVYNIQTIFSPAFQGQIQSSAGLLGS